MTVSKRWVSRPENQQKVIELYRRRECLTMIAVAERLGTTVHNVMGVLKEYLPEAEKKALSAVRYRVSKSGDKNPMRGRTMDLHHNWKGVCEDGKGYLTIIWNDSREFVHRVVMMEALGLTSLPDTLEVHHIDGDPKNNARDNLALVTLHGHRRIHFLQVKDPASVTSRKYTISEALKYMTLQSRRTSRSRLSASLPITVPRRTFRTSPARVQRRGRWRGTSSWLPEATSWFS